ncbi:triphosphoribosyl-dephospho-CoA synthase [Carboxylicivirga sp. M1479]|uniref:triphosphoribosyl-dephospho-CoA synthase n=1 Tax=Carboxylicivirga sp. M1479 TaxID=2594476 RepID=UPI0011779BD8|nr:triphosphoribosyl-dephospho-CoA synthase [Carboxylicivirga sp. M1479]TRX70662.1 hypothetical protein FNN09_10330 [Carboxylicivirga sp. M1479]
MMGEAEIFANLLEAREERQQRKLSMLSGRYHLVSLQLNIPGLPKSNQQLHRFISAVDDEFERFFTSHYPNLQWAKKEMFNDFSGDCFLYLLDQTLLKAEDLKQLTELFEQEFPLGRIVDLDVMSSMGLPISSGKAKKCFLCDKAAEECRKLQHHTITEVRECMMNAIGVFEEQQRNDSIVKSVVQYAVNGLMHEVALSPKPGLVCRNAPGAHSDMDFMTFINSCAALAPYFQELATLAINYTDKDDRKALPYIRQIGLKMEQEMLRATNGVNTHKGAVFLMCLSCFSCVRVIKKVGYFKANAFIATIQKICNGIVQKELCALNGSLNLSHGQNCFVNYGLQGAGARGEAEQGFPTIFNHALPVLSALVKHDFFFMSDSEMKQSLIPVLLKIMSVNNDTNVLYRHGKSVLEELKRKSSHALEAWKKGEEVAYDDLVEWCNSQKISSGGSADLLALTIMLFHCKNKFGKIRA